MELREWLIILGLALVTLIVIDGARRLQRQRRTPRLDEVQGDVLDDAGLDRSQAQEAAVAGHPGVNVSARRDTVDGGSDLDDPEERAREEEINWELPNGGARVIKPADFSSVQPKPKLERQEHPGPSRVLSEFRSSQAHRGRAGVTTAEAPAAGVEEKAPAAGVDRTAPAAGIDAEVERTAPAAGVETTAPAAEVEKKAPAAEVERSAPAAEVEENAHAAGVDRTAPAPAIPSEAPEASEAPPADTPSVAETPAAHVDAEAAGPADAGDRREPVLSATADDSDTTGEAGVKGAEERTARRDPNAMHLAADPEDHEDFDEDQYRLVDFEGMGDSLKDRSRRMGSSMQRFGASLQKSVSERRERREQQKAEKARLKAEQKAEAAKRKAEQDAENAAKREREQAERQHLAAEREAALKRSERERITAERQRATAEHEQTLQASHQAPAAEPRWEADVPEPEFDVEDGSGYAAYDEGFDSGHGGKVRPHPVLEKALRHDVNAEHARDSLSNAEEIIVISVMSRDENGFPGTTLLELMMACGLRYSREMGIFHRFETEDEGSALQFSMVNVLKPGTFPIEAMDDFTTPGITLLMPLPSAKDSSAAFEAMVETAMVIVRHMGGELKDENRSVMTAQTVEFARQRVQEFERRHRLHRYQVN
ncbi:MULTISPECIES: cell division protein ZipA [Halomonas]|uniref:cell division protein ZipA n=1 Tax=Halomonas TaxID=2745 RepID=UPI001C94D345|nr:MULTISPECIES: cell division protein ZipA [Halomonas]MBY6209620.1 cell division protein ZipA [Halomonas sp. DP3Y7-2]MBY6226801.1 cell division protein ZipA [Halomonas sp. DP3Y7-1]MCA0915452.1 cell division protein ZipA [Halomonas denitrificans]